MEEKERIDQLVLDKVGVMDFVCGDGVIWFVSANYNFLFKLSLDTWKVIEAYRFPFGKPFDMFTIAFLYKEKDTITFIPSKNIGGIVRFSVIEEKMEFVEITVPDEIWGNNLEQDEIYAYLPIKNKDSILRFGKKDYAHKYMEIPKKIIGVEAIHKVNNMLWMSETLTGNLIKWNLDSNEIDTYTEKPENYRNTFDSNYVCGMVGESTIAIFPRYSNMIVTIDNGNRMLQCGQDFNEFNFEKSLFTSVHKVENKVVAYLNGYNCWKIYDECYIDIDEKKMMFSDRVCKKLLSENILVDYDRNLSMNFYEVERKKIHTLNAFIDGITSV